MRPEPLPAAKMPAMSAEMRRSDDLTTGTVVGWVVVGSLMFWPRLFIVGYAIFGRQIFNHAYDNWLVIILGFFFLPWTTVAYAVMWGATSSSVNGWEWIVVALGLLLDLYIWSRVRR
jgi:hypothetical protein